MVRLLEQGSNPLLRFLVSALAKVVKADLSRGIDKVIRRPVLIVETTPDLVVVIHRDRIGDAEILHCFADVRFVLFEGKLRGVNANDHQAAVLVFLIPGLDIRQRAQAVDAGVCPEIHQNHFAAQRLKRKWRLS